MKWLSSSTILFHESGHGDENTSQLSKGLLQAESELLPHLELQFFPQGQVPIRPRPSWENLIGWVWILSS